MAVDVWREVPFVMLLLLAGLLAIPPEQYEAAALDGASAWQQFRHVTLPNLRALLVIASTLDVINTIRQFDIINVMTGGGPVDGDRGAARADLQHRVSAPTISAAPPRSACCCC